ncbi:NADH-quinone oxidoreductase subunit L [Streptomyces sp. F63]|uniref:proton-conducting transporter transmembrane domain-containing protein n=1 Tax=Streptomyces sp. F63 TaxID=2824887 RepID=UPI001B379057|nr:proton-conducting transporter membrane subunit [Streptomyces sp. F63]MBQ0986434.1 NADH-quinone oxidoreductase subunit L [Streptomyces sp. F63]
MSGLLWALIALPLVSGAVLAVLGRRADRAAPGTAVAVAAAVLGLACAAAVTRPDAAAPLLEGLPVRLSADGLSGPVAVATAAVTLAVLVFSTRGNGPGAARARFSGLMLLFSGAMLTTVTADTLPVLLMAWELMGAASWALIGYWWREPERVRAAGTAFLTTRAADLGLYVAAGAALAGGGAAGLGLDELAGTDGPWLSVVTAGVIVAAFGKSAQLPFSFWLSRAMEGPSPVSALLHSATMAAAGAYLLLRTEPLLAASGWGGPAVAWAGAVTAVVLGLVAVAQTDLKQLLAASTCAQTGFMVLAAGTGGVTGGTLQFLGHAAAKSLAFLVAGAWLTLLGTKALPGLRGAARRHRMAGITFTVAALTLAGWPPLVLWGAKDLLLASALEHGAALYATGLAAAVVAAVYSVKALWFVWRPAPGAPAGGAAPDGGAARGGGPALPAPASWSLAGLALACAALAVLAFEPARQAFARLLGATGEPAPHGWEMLLSAALALATSAAVWRGAARPVPLPPAVTACWGDWLRLEPLARLLLVRPVLRLAGALAVFDDRVLGRAVRAAGRGALRGAGAVAVLDARGPDRAAGAAARSALRLAHATERPDRGAGREEWLDGLVRGVTAGARALGRLARRPQTGQLHQYLAQAVAAFAVLALALVLVAVR